MKIMKRLLSILILFLTVIACKKAPKLETKNSETKTTVVSTNNKLKQESEVKQNKLSENEQTIQEFLEQLKIAIKKNNSNRIESGLSFPFEHKSGGELIDSYNSFKEIKAGDGELFNKIEKANYLKDCNDEVENIKRYCISYFDDTVDITFYAVKKDNQFKLISMETPN